MVRLRLCFVLLLALDELLALQENTTANALANDIEDKKKLNDDIKKNNNTRRNEDSKKRGRARSTSSSSGSKEKKSDDGGGDTSSDTSLDISSEESSSRTSKDKYARKSSDERKGWRKWHRKCHPCPEEMGKKWRDPTIKWICGGYQRAQRSFKSLCMLHYRNCQDGTLFVKLHDHRCVNDTEREGKPHGEHFFYDYRVTITGESSKTSSDKSTTISVEEDDIYRDDDF